jgi:Ca-activated chloride channel family protein
VAKDVKLQVEFNPALVAGYRLVGYENRMLNDEDFNNDRKDAGELGSGHTVTALYEIVPRGVPMPSESNIDPLRYQKPAKAQQKGRSDEELLFVKARYKEPDGNESRLLSFALRNKKDNTILSDNFRFAAAVAGFGMLLRNSPYKGTADYATVRAQALQALGNDREGYRKEFIGLVDKAQQQGLVRRGSIVE